MEDIEEAKEEVIPFKGIPDVIERYYSQFFLLNADGQEEHDQYIYQHTNFNCIIGVGPVHPLLREGKTVTNINFKPGKFDYLNVKVKGKAKRGGHWMEPNTPLCQVTCSDGTVYTLVSCVRGRLIEVNTQLLSDPSLLTTPAKARKEGYLAIIRPKYEEMKMACDKLTPHNEYIKLRSGSQQPQQTSSSSSTSSPSSSSSS